MLVLDAKMLVKGAVLSLALGSNSSPLLVAAVQPTAPQSSTETYPSFSSRLQEHISSFIHGSLSSFTKFFEPRAQL